MYEWNWARILLYIQGGGLTVGVRKGILPVNSQFHSVTRLHFDKRDDRVVKRKTNKQGGG